MKLITSSVLRRFWPALAVTTLLGLSLIAPSAPLGSSESVAFGYGNNCGVKGYGFHDHGKPCPNRPFPGHRKNTRHSEDGSSASETAENSTTIGSSASTTLSMATTTSGDTEQSRGNDHHGKGHGRGKGRD